MGREVHNSCQSPGSQPAQGQSPTPNTANLHKSTYPSERKELTGKAGGEPCCLSVSEPDVCVVAGDRCLPTNCTQAQWTHTSISTSPFPSCQMAVLPSGTWHSCKKARTVPTCCHCPPCLGMAGAAQQQPKLLAATHSSVVPNLCNSPPAQHYREELALDFYYDQT